LIKYFHHKNKTKNPEAVAMKFNKSATHSKTHSVPELRFEEQELTSFSGLAIIQPLLQQLKLKSRLRQCFRPQACSSIYGFPTMVLLLVLHIMMGYRKLSDLKFYQDDPLVAHTLGLKRLPDSSTLSRHLNLIDATNADRLRQLAQHMVLDRLIEEQFKMITLDFDGSVISTTRWAEGTAVGYNKKKKGQRSYYPLVCTIAQTSQVFDSLFRAGNVHDSNGARQFIVDCVEKIREFLPKAVIEVRMDSAFYSEEIIDELERQKVEFTISVPFARYPRFKEEIEKATQWVSIDKTNSYREHQWKPNKWKKAYRILSIRKRVLLQQKGVVQLDLFTPYQDGYDFQVIVTNKKQSAGKVMNYHRGRGAQEGIFAELKSYAQMDYIPVKYKSGNQVYFLCSIMAHNLSRELQMKLRPQERKRNDKRAPLWEFESLSRFRNKIIRNAGRLIKPQGRLVLSMNANAAAKEEMEFYQAKLI